MAPALPGFEGAEKRVEARFVGPASLRRLRAPALHAALRAAACSVLSVARDTDADAYLLSESSLFVFDSRLVIKTCGTTALLRALPVLLDAAAALGLRPVYLQYSRAAFLFPDRQPAPHTSFAAEASFIDGILGPARAGVALRVAHPLPTQPINASARPDLAWHLYVADMTAPLPASVLSPATSLDSASLAPHSPGDSSSGTLSQGDSATTLTEPARRRYDPAQSQLQTLEICMYDLDRKVMQKFMGNGDPGSDVLVAQDENQSTPGAQVVIRDHDRGHDRDRRADLCPGFSGDIPSGLLRESAAFPTRKACSVTTERSGIARLVHPATLIDAHDFHPCGYSMNGLVPAGAHPRSACPAYYTIHVTPESEASFVSFETSLPSDALASTVASVVKLFKPSRFAVAFVGSPEAPALVSRPSDPIQCSKLGKLLWSTYTIASHPTLLEVSPNCVTTAVAFESRYDPCVRPLSPPGCPKPFPIEVQNHARASSHARLDLMSGNSHCKGVGPDFGDLKYLELESPISPSLRSIADTFGALVFTYELTSEWKKFSNGQASDSKVTEAPSSWPQSMDAAISSFGCDDASSAVSADSASSSECQHLPDALESLKNSKVTGYFVSSSTVAHVLAESAALDLPVFVVDLGVLERRIHAVRQAFGPSVRLRYAVRCNSDPAILSVLNANGIDFEAASIGEVKLLRRAGVPVESIMLVSPTISSETIEQLGYLHSVAVYCHPSSVPDARLLKTLQDRGIALEVHVAPGGGDDALQLCATVAASGCRVCAVGLDLPPDTACLPMNQLTTAIAEGLQAVRYVLNRLPKNVAEGVVVTLGELCCGGPDAILNLLDPSHGIMLHDLPPVALDAGRFIVGPAAALATSVIGRRRVACAPRSTSCSSYNYYLDDGVYGAFSSVLMEQVSSSLECPDVFRLGILEDMDEPSNPGPVNRLSTLNLVETDSGEPRFDCTLFGPTCDALDRIWTGNLPMLHVGDVVAFGNMGAYSGSATSQFNGFASQFDTRYVLSKSQHIF